MAPQQSVLQHVAPLQQRLAPIFSCLERLELIQAITAHQHQEDLGLEESSSQQQNIAEIKSHLDKIQAADAAHLLSMLPQTLRLFIWGILEDNSAAEVICELQDSIVEDLLEATSEERLRRVLPLLEAQELLEISNEVDHETVQQALKQAISSLDDEERNWIRDARHYEEDQIGHMMNMDKVTVLQHLKVSDVVDHLQNLDELPEQTDKIFIVTRTQRLMGEVTLIELLRNRGEKDIAAVMEEEAITFLDTDTVEEAIIAFEHYDLVSAAVVNHRGRLVGRLTVESVMDVTMERADEKVLAREGLSADSDLFGPVLEAARQRWAWLAVNLITAFTASRFISLFEDTIAELVALATLMPIVASIGGNTGNQTITLFTRGLVLDQIRSNNLRYLIQKELTVSLLNGCLWGGVLGCVSGLLYQNLGLGVVLATATLLNLVLAAGFGMWVPLTLDKLGKDPALGSSVVLTFCTDSLGFLIFLGLASAFLVP